VDPLDNLPDSTTEAAPSEFSSWVRLPWIPLLLCGTSLYQAKEADHLEIG
jgi:hypothetical protein